MPILIGGKGGGTLPGGRIIDVRDAGNDGRRACSLYLSIMDRMAVKLPRFGDSDRRLEQL